MHHRIDTYPKDAATKSFCQPPEDPMKPLLWISYVRACLLSAGPVLADVVETTPYPYAKPPAPGIEKGTYAYNGSGFAGPDCFFTIAGTAKFLPNTDGSGGSLCAKSNIQFVGTGPFCTSET